MFFLANHGYRVIAHDRRGHGRSSQPWDGHDIDTWADDLAQLIEHLDVKNITLVGHSTGGGEISRYVGRHGQARVQKLVLISSIPPTLMQTEWNPNGVPKAVFETFRTELVKDRAQFFIDVPTGPFFGFNREGVKKSQGLIDSWFQAGMMCSFKAVYDCVSVWQQDYREDLKKMNFPVLIIHGDDDQIAPFPATGQNGIKILPQGTLKVYQGGPHALPDTHKEEVNKDLLEFLRK